MKKKLLSVVLMLVMVLSLAGCGSKAATTPKDVLAKMADAEVGTGVYEVSLVVGDESMDFKITAAQKDDSNASVLVEAKLNMPESGYTISEYVPLTEILVVDGETFYINLGQVMDFLVEIDSQFAMIESYLGLPGDYLKVSYDDLVKLYEDMGMDTSELALAKPTALDKAIAEKNADAMVEVIGDLLNEYAKNAGENVLVVADDKITFTMDNSNFATVVEALSTIDVEGYMNTLGTKLDEINNTDEFSKLMAEEFAGANDAIKSAAEDAKTNGVGDGFEKMVATMGLNGKNVEVVVDVTGKESSAADAGDVKIYMNMVMTPEKASDITAPTSIITFEEFMEIVNSLMGM